MKLPYRKDVIIQTSKLIKYLLSLTNPDGKVKAEFFRKSGFNENNISLFRQSLLEVANNNEVKKVEKYEYGIKYVVEGLMQRPSGQEFIIRTIWSVDKGKKFPRLITAYRI